jgi:hypothetical protein
MKTIVLNLQSSKFVEFDWTDPLNLEGCLTEEEVMVRDAAKAYAQVRLCRHVYGLFTQSHRLCGTTKIGLILSVQIVSYYTFRCCMTKFSLISVGLCKCILLTKLIIRTIGEVINKTISNRNDVLPYVQAPVLQQINHFSYECKHLCRYAHM